jgi:TonB family protein
MRLTVHFSSAAFANGKIAIAAALCLLLANCAADPEKVAADRLNAYWENLERHPSSQNSPLHDLKVKLWQDQPEYAALIDDIPPHRPRIITLVMPECPPVVSFLRVQGDVDVSYVIGADGNVEAARILKSSNVAFNDPALKAVWEFKFRPASGPEGPRKYLTSTPIHFQPGYRPSAHVAPMSLIP